MNKIFFAFLLLGVNELSAAAERELAISPDFDSVAPTYLGSKIMWGFKASELQSMIATRRLIGGSAQTATLDALSSAIQDSLNGGQIDDTTGIIAQSFRLRGGKRFRLTGKGYKFFDLRVRAGQFRALNQAVPAEFAAEIAEG